MRYDAVMAPLLLQLAIPLGLLVRLAFGRHRSRAAWLFEGVLVATYLLAISAAGMWLALPWTLSLLWLLLFPLALLRSLRGFGARPALPVGPGGWTGAGARGALAGAATLLALYAVSGRRPPDGLAVDLSFPLERGTFQVVNGGSVELVNAHLATLGDEERFRAWRGQSYGVDIVALGRWSARANGVAPRDPAAYAAFGTPIVAPCGGVVEAAVDGLPDLSPPDTDREHMAGNHVILRCGDVWVVIGHMRRGRVCVRDGEPVRPGQRIGEVGNSGNTGEPHLHIHAQRPGTAAEPMSGEPLPILFEGHYLVRNAIVERSPDVD